MSTENSNEEKDGNGCLSNIGMCLLGFIVLWIVLSFCRLLWNVWNDAISPAIIPGVISIFRDCTYELDQVVKIEISEIESRGYLTHLTKTPWACDEEVRIELQEATLSRFCHY